jgi:hypothetical protein
MKKVHSSLWLSKIPLCIPNFIKPKILGMKGQIGPKPTILDNFNTTLSSVVYYPYKKN